MKHYLLRYLRKKVEDATVFILLSAWFVAVTILMGASVFLGNISYLWVAFGVIFAPLMAIGIFLLAAWVYGGVEHQIQQYRFLETRSTKQRRIFFRQ